MFQSPRKRGVLQLEGVLQLGGIRYLYLQYWMRLFQEIVFQNEICVFTIVKNARFLIRVKRKK